MGDHLVHAQPWEHLLEGEAEDAVVAAEGASALGEGVFNREAHEQLVQQLGAEHPTGDET